MYLARENGWVRVEEEELVVEFDGGWEYESAVSEVAVLPGPARSPRRRRRPVCTGAGYERLSAQRTEESLEEGWISAGGVRRFGATWRCRAVRCSRVVGRWSRKSPKQNAANSGENVLDRSGCCKLRRFAERRPLCVAVACVCVCDDAVKWEVPPMPGRRLALCKSR